MKNIVSSKIILLGKEISEIDNLLPWKLIADIPKFFESDSFISEYKIKDVVINEEDGPVIIESTAKIEPYTILNGPVYIGSNVLIKSHSNISNSIIEHDCKIKGEVHSSIFQPFSNKAHDGFIGNSFIGSWTNLGAGTTTSNLKNNYSNVSVKWNGDLVDTESIFFGSVIGEHVKTSIGTNLNTGTIIEMGSNIVTQSFPPRHIPSFSFYYKGKISKISFEDFKNTATIAMSRRNRDFSSVKDTFFNLYKKD
jgi:UDP-N-acetylglucosamine diphosphorylase/glucosamine-1-phosphate N-acetyltransferase|tara:strand:- start:3123 stop:3878 length:756 start_codon:yes stop_codon:yes gene_type:complete